jgi:serine/threonine protein phosphatase PrpC
LQRNRVSAEFLGVQAPESKPAMLDVEFAEISDCGPVRPHNEDFIGHSLPLNPEQVRNRGWIFTLADGVGGQDRGEVASRLTVETVLSECAKAVPGENSSSLLTRAIQAANTKVYEEAHGGIATTLVACVLRFDRATIAHVGDSRCYLIRHGRPKLLTRDHTVVNEQVRLGILTEQEGRRATTKNVLSRSIGSNLFVSPEVSEHNVRSGDLLLLCSDGLHGAVSDDKIMRIATSGASLNDAAQQLVTIANESDGGDNVSVQLIRVKTVEAVGMYRGRPYRLH